MLNYQPKATKPRHILEEGESLIKQVDFEQAVKSLVGK